MSGNKCQFINCGLSRRKVPTLKLFRFPKKPVLHCEWILNSGNESLSHVSADRLHNMYVCERHFRDANFSNRKKSRLNKNAIPIHYQESVLSIYNPTKTNSKNEGQSSPIQRMSDNSNETNESSYNSALECCTKFHNDHIIYINTERKGHSINKLQSIIKSQKKNLAAKRSTISRLKSKVKTLNQRISSGIHNLSNFEYKSLPSKVLCGMQMSHKERTEWSLDEKHVALFIYYKSPTAYKFLLKSLKIVLPSISTIQKWKWELSSVLEYNPSLDVIEKYDDLGEIEANKK